MQNPQARENNIVVQKVFDEFVIYDLDKDRVHALNPMAAFVWQHCTGQRTPADLTALIRQEFQTPQAESLLWLALDRLEQAYLLQDKVTRPTGSQVVTRRQMFKMAGVGLALIPVVASIVAPTVAQAASSQCVGFGLPCTSNSDCCSNNCVGVPPNANGTCGVMN